MLRTIAFLLAIASSCRCYADISYSVYGSSYSQSFDSLSNTTGTTLRGPMTPPYWAGFQIEQSIAVRTEVLTPALCTVLAQSVRRNELLEASHLAVLAQFFLVFDEPITRARH